MSAKGSLAEAEAIEQAEQECLSDAEARDRRRERDTARRADEDVRFEAELAAAIGKLFPGWTKRGRASPRFGRRTPSRCSVGPARRHRL